MELNIGIICASLPTLRALLAKFLPNTFSSSIGGAHQGYDHTDQSGRGQLIHTNDTIPTIQTDGSIVVRDEPNVDLEKGKGTFLASDSEAEGGAQPPQMAQVR